LPLSPGLFAPVSGANVEFQGVNPGATRPTLIGVPFSPRNT